MSIGPPTGVPETPAAVDPFAAPVVHIRPPQPPDLSLPVIHVPMPIAEWHEGRINPKTDNRSEADRRSRKGIQGVLQVQHLAALTGLYLLARECQDPRMQGRLRIVGSRDYIADVCGWTHEALREHLEYGGLLTPWARLVKTERDDEDAWLSPEDDSEVEPENPHRWIIHLEPVAKPFAQIPAWWLWEPYIETLSNGREVQRRRRRALIRDETGQWRNDGQWQASDPALLGAFLAWSKVDFETGKTRNKGAAARWVGEDWWISKRTASKALAAADRRGFVASSRRTGGRDVAALRRVVLNAAERPGSSVEQDRARAKAVRERRSRVHSIEAESAQFPAESAQFTGERAQFTGERAQYSAESAHAYRTDWSEPINNTDSLSTEDVKTDRGRRTPGSASHVPGRFHDDVEEFASNGDKQVPALVLTSQPVEEETGKGGLNKGTRAGPDDLSLAGTVGGWTDQEQDVVDALATAGIDVALTDESRDALAAVLAVGLDAAGTVEQMLAMLSREPSLRRWLADGYVSHLLHDLVPTDWVSDVHRASGLRRGSEALEAWFDRQAS